MNETIGPGVRLEIRKTSPYYQAVLRDGEGRWRRYSTKTEDRDLAIAFAQQKRGELQVLADHGISAGDKRFDYVAGEYLKEMAADEAAGTAKASQGTYVKVTRNWLIPFFGPRYLHQIDDGLVAAFEEHRRQKMGREPAKSTVNKHNIVLRAVLEYAVKRKWLKRSEIPKLTVKNKGVAAQRRGFFEYDEWSALATFLHSWDYPEFCALAW